ncbi:hypothetical protein K438DRAFT_1942488 [Mycena galopus ATCC 62051]|nr:hypothetical protein K438DRAFT_1942488 [Mycena galopus ATCC 62051]
MRHRFRFPPPRAASLSSFAFDSEMRMNGTGIVFRSTPWRLAFAAPPYPHPCSCMSAVGVSQLTQSEGSASQFTRSEGGSQFTRSESGDGELVVISRAVIRRGGELLVRRSRGKRQDRMRMGFIPAEDTAAEVDGEKYSQEQAPTGEQSLTGGEEVSAMSWGAPHEGSVGGRCMGASGEETGSGQCRQLGAELYGVVLVQKRCSRAGL